MESFEPTYEGLKLSGGFSAPLVSKRFEPTYEGLKLIGFDTPDDLMVRFEPTYEGLKLAYLQGSRLRAALF